METELVKERSEWEQTYQQLTEAIAAKEVCFLCMPACILCVRVYMYISIYILFI
jgi:hypothetical protein